MGMGMVDAIFEKGARARADGDWAELLKVLTSGKVSLFISPSSIYAFSHCSQERASNTFELPMSS